MMSVARLVCAALLFFVVPAAAELTDTERTDVQSFVRSINDLRAAESFALSAIRCCWTVDSRPALRQLLVETTAAQIEHWQALAHFLHVSAQQPTGTPDLTADVWRQRAWFYTDRYALALDRVRTAVTAAQAHFADNANYQDALRRVLLWTGTAKAKVTGLHRDLLYDNPWPALRPDKTVPTVVGPHGNYRRAQWRVNFGKKYILDAYDLLLTLAATTNDGAVLRDAWTQSSAALAGLDLSTALLAGVTFTADEAGEDAFCRALRVSRRLTLDVSGRFEAWMVELARLSPGPVPTILAKAGDAWKHGIDLGTWELLVFPESTRCPALLP